VSGEHIGLDHVNTETVKIVWIQSYHCFDTMCYHEGCHSRVVGALSANGRMTHQLPPEVEKVGAFKVKAKLLAQLVYVTVRYIRIPAEAIVLGRSCSDNPELNKNLRRETDLILSFEQHINGRTTNRVLWVPAINQSQHDVRVKKIRCHQ
jgi:hypothetical protein